MRSRKTFFQVIYYTPYRICLPLKVFFRHRSSFVKGCLPSTVVFHQRSSSVKSCLPLTVVFRERSSYAKGRPPAKVRVRLSTKVFFHQIICRDSPNTVLLYVGTAPTLCILNVGTVPTLCILNVGNVPTFSPFELVFPQWPLHPCRQRAQRRRGPKIVNFSRTEGCRTKNWGRIKLQLWLRLCLRCLIPALTYPSP